MTSPPTPERAIHCLLVALAAMAATGCRTSPTSSAALPPKPAVAPAATPAAAAAAAAANPAATAAANPEAAAAAGMAAVAPPSSPAAPPQKTGPDPQAMLQVVAQVQQMGQLEPEAQQRLMQDLQQTDPALWPLVVQQFRAALAYRQQVQMRRSGPAGTPAMATAPAIDPRQPSSAAPPVDQAPSQNGTPDEQSRVARRESSTPANSKGHHPPVEPEPQKIQPPASTRVVEPVPAAGASTERAATIGPGQSAEVPATRSSQSTTAKGEKATSSVTKGEVIAAGYTAAEEDWQKHLATAIRKQEAELEGKSGEADAAAQARLRMLYLIAGRRDDAMRPIATPDPAQQAFWSAELFGLSVWMDPQRNPDGARRAAQTQEHLGEALVKLGQLCPLVVRNLAFCTRIEAYGRIEPFEKNEFLPGQRVLMYAEVENLSHTSTPRGYHTALRSRCQIFDSRQRRVAEIEFPSTEEHCRNVRRDYFVGCDFQMPERLEPGTHSLQLTVEDLKSQKVGQSTIEFTIRKGQR